MGAHAQQFARRFHRVALACLAMAPFVAHVAASGQVVHGAVSSAVGAGRVSGAVVLLLDSSLTTYARALTSDSGTFAVGPGTRGRFHLKVMRIGFRPTESAAFDLTRDTTIDVALADIPVILPAVTTRDRNDCRLHPDTTNAGVLTFALWDEARTALLAAAITQERQDYRFGKLLHVRIYDVHERALRDIALRETESHGAAAWTSLPAERLRENGYTIEDDSGTTFFAPDIDVLLSPYFTEDHCFRLTSRRAPAPGSIGLDFEPAGRLRHVEIRGTVWLDSATKELHTVSFAFANLPISAPDTILGGRITFARLTTGAWIIPSWSIRMPTPVRAGVMRNWSPGFGPRTIAASRARWHLTADQIRVQGGDLRSVRRGETADSMLWHQATGAVRVRAVTASDSGPAPASGVIVRLAGSPYGGYSSLDGHVRFEQVLPGTYLFEATTPLHEAIEASAERTTITVKADSTQESQVTLKPLGDAVREVCEDPRVGRHDSVLAGRVTFGPSDSPMPKVKVTVEWPGGTGEIRTRDDGYYRICGVPRKTLLLVRASAEQLMVTQTVTFDAEEIVRRLDLKLQP